MDPGTLEALYTTHGPMVLRRARLLLHDDQAARDALHDVFLRVLRAEGEFRAQASPATWLYRIATNHCLNVLRDERRRVELRTRYLRPASEAGGDADAPIQLAQILRNVRPELQEIAIYHLVDELKHEEIAELLGVSRRTIDAAQAVTAYGSALALAGGVPRILDGSIILDDTLGPERIVAVVCDWPIAGELGVALARGALATAGGDPRQIGQITCGRARSPSRAAPAPPSTPRPCRGSPTPR